jgi:hypothetical protein
MDFFAETAAKEKCTNIQLHTKIAKFSYSTGSVNFFLYINELSISVLSGGYLLE